MITTTVTRPTIAFKLSFNTFAHGDRFLTSVAIHYENTDPEAPRPDRCVIVPGYHGDNDLDGDLSLIEIAYRTASITRGLIEALRFAGAEAITPEWVDTVNTLGIERMLTSARNTEIKQETKA